MGQQCDEPTSDLNTATAKQTDAHNRIAQLSQATTNEDTLTQQRDDLTATLTATNPQQTEASAAPADARREVRQHQSALASAIEQRQSVTEQYQQTREQLALKQTRSQSATETINELKARMA